jgi:hypothetical protein
MLIGGIDPAPVNCGVAWLDLEVLEGRTIRTCTFEEFVDSVYIRSVGSENRKIGKAVKGCGFEEIRPGVELLCSQLIYELKLEEVGVEYSHLYKSGSQTCGVYWGMLFGLGEIAKPVYASAYKKWLRIDGGNHTLNKELALLRCNKILEEKGFEPETNHNCADAVLVALYAAYQKLKL